MNSCDVTEQAYKNEVIGRKERQMRLIDADALMAQLEDRQAVLVKEWGYRDHYTRGFEEAADKIGNASSVDAVKVVHGRWVEIPSLLDLPWKKYWCDHCGCPQDYKHNYCPNCGAKMDLE